MLLTTLFFNFFRYFFSKLKYAKRYKSSYIERIHKSVDIRLFGKKSQIEIGHNVEIAKDGELWCFGNGKIKIGNKCYFNNRLMISSHCEVSIGDECLFGPDVKIFDNNHKFTYEKGVSSELSSSPVNIGSHCWIASNAVILKGTTIGNNCIIGAGCIVSGNIPDCSIVKKSKDNIVIEKIKSKLS